MRKLFMTDIHGENHAMLSLLKHANFNPLQDYLVVGGDMIDRGKDSGLVLKHLKALCDHHPKNVRVVMGNHEAMAVAHYKNNSDMWLMHGGREAQASFKKVFTADECERHIEWIAELPLCVEDDEFVYTHAGIELDRPLNAQSPEIVWMHENEFYLQDKEKLLKLTGGKPVVHGHTPVEYIYFDGARINCDMGSATYPIIEERGLALVDLTSWQYYVYRFHMNKIEARNILRFA